MSDETDDAMAVQWMKARIEALSDLPVSWSKTAWTPRRTIHVQFSNGFQRAVGDVRPPTWDPSCALDLAEAMIDAVREYRKTIRGRAGLVWRVEPEITRGDDRRVSAYCRLCFEPEVAVEEPDEAPSEGGLAAEGVSATESYGDRLISADMAVVGAWDRFRDAVNDRAALLYTTGDERTRWACDLARKLYRLRTGADFSPIEDQPVINSETPFVSGKGIAILGDFMPAWQTYYADALEMLNLVLSSERDKK